MRRCKIAAIALASGLVHEAFAQSIIGGANDDTNTAYAAFVSTEGILTPLTLSSDSPINSVAINANQTAIIGGGEIPNPHESFPPYAAIITPTETINVSNMPPLGIINSVAINNSSIAIIGGSLITSDFDRTTFPYAAIVTLPGGNAVPLSLTTDDDNGYISSVAINNSSIAIIGGADNSTGNAYVALVSSGNVNPLSDLLPGSGSVIYSVAINNSSTAIIGGADGYTHNAYAAFVSSDGTVTLPIWNPSPPGGESYISSVAINNSSVAIVGGIDQSVSPANAYAAFVYPSGQVIPLSNLPGNGSIINSVAINDAQTAIIGGIGFDDDFISYAYAALASPNNLTPLNLLSFDGQINSVAINNAQAAVIGGSNFDTGYAYAALISPQGIVTSLNLNFDGQINSVAIVMNAITPASVGSYGSLFNSTFAASFAMQSHTLQHKHLWTSQKTAETQVSLLVDNQPDNQLPPSNGAPQFEPSKPSSYTLWFAPFNDFIHQAKQGSIPSFTNEIAGGIAALDYRRQDDVFGGGLAYAFDYAHYSQSLGHAKINEEMGVLFASLQRNIVFINATIWGGLYQLNNERHSLPSITSIGKTHGWILSPHLELSIIPYRDADWFNLEPFAMVDWANCWQKHFTESDPAGFNLVMPHQYSSLLRSETGLRFYENLRYGWGHIQMEEKGSYINQTPFHVESATTFFVGAISNFTVATGSSKMQNLGGVEFNCMFIPWKDKYPYGSLDLQGEFGSSLQSYFVGLEIGKRF